MRSYGKTRTRKSRRSNKRFTSKSKSFIKRGKSKRQSQFRKRRGMLHVNAKTSGAYSNSFNKVSFGKKISKNPRVRQIERLGTQNRFQYFQAITVSTSLGNQQVQSFVYTSADDLRACATNMGIAGSTAFDSVQNTNNWVLKKDYTVWEMANQSSGMVFCDLYYYHCIRDTGSLPSELWLEGNQDQQGSSGVTLRAPGLVPTGDQRVAMFWKLKKVVHHCIKPGEVHQQVMEYEHHKMVYNELLYSESGIDRGNLYLGGYTNAVMMVIRGVPSVTTLDVPTTANCAVIIRASKTVDTTWLQDTSRNLRVDNLIATGAGTVDVYNQGSGQIEAVDTVV